MTPPSPEDTSLPPRHRPSLEAFVKNSREEDLWDLADPPADAAQEAAPVPMLPRKNMPSVPLSPLDEASVASDADAAAPPVLPVTLAPRHQNSQSVNVARLGRVRISRDPLEPEPPLAPSGAAGTNLLEDTFASLEDWDLPEEEPEEASTTVLQAQAEGPPAQPASQVLAAAAPPDTLSLALSDRQIGILPVMVDSESRLSAHESAGWKPDVQDRQDPGPPAEPTVLAAPPAAAAHTPPAAQEPAAPAAKPLSLRPRLQLTKLETIGLIVLASILLAGGYWVYANSLSHLLTQAAQVQEITFPIHGTQVTVSNVVTYWRKPLKTGDQAEAVRRGVVLIPVVEITLQGGPGAIRALVRNDSGLAVGDPITRQIDGPTTLLLPATDGFEDISMHAAYRTGQIKPWTVRVFEATSSNARGKDFKKLLDVPISAEKR